MVAKQLVTVDPSQPRQPSKRFRVSPDVRAIGWLVTAISTSAFLALFLAMTVWNGNGLWDRFASPSILKSGGDDKISQYQVAHDLSDVNDAAEYAAGDSSRAVVLQSLRWAAERKGLPVLGDCDIGGRAKGKK